MDPPFICLLFGDGNSVNLQEIINIYFEEYIFWSFTILGGHSVSDRPAVEVSAKYPSQTLESLSMRAAFKETSSRISVGETAK